MSHPTVRRLTILVLLLALAFAAPAAAAGKRPQPPTAVPFVDSLVQVLEWFVRLGHPAPLAGRAEKTAPSVAPTEGGTTEAQRISLDRGAMIDPNG